MVRFFHTLNRKMIAFLIIVLGVSLVITIFFSIQIERLNALQSAKDKVQSFAKLIQMTLCQAMEEGQGNSVAAIVRILALPKDFMTVRIFDHEGKIFGSSKEEEGGKVFLTPKIHHIEEGVVLTQSYQGERVLSTLMPFYNEAQCIRCHQKDKKILGYLNVDFPLASIEDQLSSQTKMQILSGFSILFMMSGAMFIFFSNRIKRPLLVMAGKMLEVEKWDFNVTIPVKSQDELGHLARSFNFMVRTLHEMKIKEAEQQDLLRKSNESLQERMKQLNNLHESSRAINRSFHIEEILRMTLDNVTKSLGFDRVVLMMFDEKKETLVGRWSIGIDEEIVPQVRIPREDMKGILLETFEKREPILVKDTASHPVFDRREAKKCWEVLTCPNKTCPIYGTNELRCWMTKGTRCDLEMKEDTFEEKMRQCGRCAYLKEIVRRSDIVNLLLFGSHSFISAPLIAREEVIGILLADKLHSGREINGEDTKLLMTFVAHVSVAVENAALYQKLEQKVDLGQRQLQKTNEKLIEKIDEINEIRSFNESVLQNLHGGIVTFNKEGMITFMNKSGAELLGWEAPDVLGKSIDEVLCCDGKGESLFQKSLKGSGDTVGEVEILKKGGGMVPVETFLSYLRDKEGNVSGVTGIFRDITEKKEIEARMQRMDKLATLGQLASGIAHEIKNPLAGISSTLQVISSSLQLEGVKKEMVKEVFNQIKRLDDTIKNLLRFAKPGLPKMTLADPREVIENVLFLVSQPLKEQNIEVNLDIHGEPFKVMMDLQLIQQALLNVVLNSVHAMPSGGNLVFSMKERHIPDPSGKESKSYVSLIISDAGTGIPDDVLPQIFNPFYTTKTKGTGLGLSITQRIIEQHNGRIEVKSEMGKGTSFSIDLPA